jgi:hypothetical protein
MELIIIPVANERIQRNWPKSGPQCATIATPSGHDVPPLA